MEAKNVLIVGAGAVGSFFATKLLSAGHEVVVLEQPTRANAIRTAGFRMQEGKEVLSARPVAVVTSLADAFPGGVEYDLLLLTTKAYDAPAFLKQLPSVQQALPRKVMTIQNGIGMEELAAKLLDPARVLAASFTVPVSISAAGSVTVEKKGRGVALAPVAPGENISEWVNLMAGAQIETRGHADYRAVKWSKLLLNIVANATCAILNRKPAVIYRYRPTFMVERAMLLEALAVIKALDLKLLNLPGSPAKLLAPVISRLPAGLAQTLLQTQIASGRGDKMPSLHLDLSAGRKKSEVAFLNGAISRVGREVGVATPVNDVLAETLFKLFSGLLLWDDFRGKPEALLARVRAAT